MLTDSAFSRDEIVRHLGVPAAKIACHPGSACGASRATRPADASRERAARFSSSDRSSSAATSTADRGVRARRSRRGARTAGSRSSARIAPIRRDRSWPAARALRPPTSPRRVSLRSYVDEETLADLYRARVGVRVSVRVRRLRADAARSAGAPACRRSCSTRRSHARSTVPAARYVPPTSRLHDASGEALVELLTSAAARAAVLRPRRRRARPLRLDAHGRGHAARDRRGRRCLTRRRSPIVIVSYNVRGELDACLRVDRRPHRALPDPRSSSSTTARPTARRQMVRDALAGRAADRGRRQPRLRARQQPRHSRDAERSRAAAQSGHDRRRRAPFSTLVRGARRPTRTRPRRARGSIDARRRGRSCRSAGRSSPLGELRQKIVGGLYDRRVGRVVRRVERWTRTAGEREWVSGACLLVRRARSRSGRVCSTSAISCTPRTSTCACRSARGRDDPVRARRREVAAPARPIGGPQSADRAAAAPESARVLREASPGWVPLLRLLPLADRQGLAR